MPDNVMLRFPQYGFVPTSLIRFRPNFWVRGITIVFFTGLILILAVMGFYEPTPGYQLVDSGRLMLATMITTFCMTVLPAYAITAVACRHPLRRAFPGISPRVRRFYQDIDYSQEFHNHTAGFVFVVTDDKFGLLDVQSLRMQIPPVYDQLSWYTPGSVLLAIDDGRKVLLDLYGNELR